MPRYQPRDPNPDLMTPGEVAAVFRVDPKTVTRWAAAGRIPSIQTPGGQRRFRRSNVDYMLKFGAEAQPFNPGDGPVPGYVAGRCGHRVAESEWLAGYRTCERCPEQKVRT